MTQQNSLERAKQGDPSAIAALINRTLRSVNIQVSIQRTRKTLIVVATSKTPPPKNFVVNFIKNGLLKLDIPNIEFLTIKGRVSGKTDFVWQETINLKFPDHPLDPQALSAATKTRTKTAPKIVLPPYLAPVEKAWQGYCQFWNKSTFNRAVVVVCGFILLQGMTVFLGYLRVASPPAFLRTLPKTTNRTAPETTGTTHRRVSKDFFDKAAIKDQIDRQRQNAPRNLSPEDIERIKERWAEVHEEEEEESKPALQPRTGSCDCPNDTNAAGQPCGDGTADAQSGERRSTCN